MGKFNFIETGIQGLTVIEPKIFGDERGYFMESYNYNEFRLNGLDMEFVQDNQSLSKMGVLRGLHFQTQFQQGKLVRVVFGSVYDVAVDLRKNSKTYGKHFGIILSAENKNQFYVPEGFAHGFVVLTDEAQFSYKVTEYYHPEFESGIIWNDPDIAIEWPIDLNFISLSEKDKKLPYFKDIVGDL